MDRRGRHPRLAAVLFTDIVRSTETASTLGDRRWRELLTRHHRIIRSELKRYGGHEHDTAGDGFFASFSAPADAIRCAAACAAGVRQLGVEIRAGVNFRRGRDGRRQARGPRRPRRSAAPGTRRVGSGARLVVGARRRARSGHPVRGSRRASPEGAGRPDARVLGDRHRGRAPRAP